MAVIISLVRHIKIIKAAVYLLIKVDMMVAVYITYEQVDGMDIAIEYAANWLAQTSFAIKMAICI